MKIFIIFAIYLTILSTFGRSNPTSCPNNNLQWFPHQTDCSRYFVCRQGDLFERSCAPGLLFNNLFGQCTLPQNSYCALSCPVPDSSEVLVFLPNFQDCSKYYVCDAGTAVPGSCANGLLFDTDNNWCDFPSNVDCASRGNGTVSDDPNRTTTNATPQTTKTTTTTTTTTTTERPTTTPRPTISPMTTQNPDVFDCPQEIGPLYFPHTIYCFKYFECRYGMATLRQCASGLVFDYIDGVCKENGRCFSENN